jgi:hypothetical protein
MWDAWHGGIDNMPPICFDFLYIPGVSGQG